MPPEEKTVNESPRRSPEGENRVANICQVPESVCAVSDEAETHFRELRRALAEQVVETRRVMEYAERHEKHLREMHELGLRDLRDRLEMARNRYLAYESVFRVIKSLVPNQDIHTIIRQAVITSDYGYRSKRADNDAPADG